MDAMEKRLQDVLGSHFDGMKRLADAGLADVLNNIDTTCVVKNIAGAKDAWILQTWIPEAIATLNAVEKCIINGGRVRILLLNPDSDLGIRRSRQLGYQNDTQARDCTITNLQEIVRVRSRLGKLRDNLTVRLFDSLPVISVYAYDDRMHVGSFWQTMPAVDGPQLYVRGIGCIYGDTVREHFEAAWASAIEWECDATEKSTR